MIKKPIILQLWADNELEVQHTYTDLGYGLTDKEQMTKAVDDFKKQFGHLAEGKTWEIVRVGIQSRMNSQYFRIKEDEYTRQVPELELNHH